MIQCVWWDQGRGNWDSGLLCSVFDKYPELFPQHNSKELIYPERAIVIVVGKPEIPPLRAWLETLKSGLVILTSDEDSYFDWKAAIPPHLEIWTQYFATNKSEIKTRLLLGAPNRIKDYKINHHLPKKYLWSFVGQMQNPFRDQCINLLKTLPDGFLHRAATFGGIEGGIEYQEYLDIMCQSKYVICPAGSMCVDSFRLYEALECGAVPITDKRSPRDHFDFDYWKECGVYDNILTVDNWNELPDLLHKGPTPVNKCWWDEYKLSIDLTLFMYATDED